MYGIQKDGSDEFIFRAAMEKHTQRTDIENRPMDMGRGEERVERITWKLTLPYVKQIANRNQFYDPGNSNRVSVTIQRGDGEGDGKEVWEGGNMGIPMTDSC